MIKNTTWGPCNKDKISNNP